MTIKRLIQCKQVDFIVKTFNAHERISMGLSKEYIGKDPGYWSKDEIKNICNIFIEYDKITPIAFFDITDAGEYLNAAVGVYNNKQYRGKGYAQKVVQKGLDWYLANKNKFDNKPIYWWAKTDNLASCQLAEKCGFRQDVSIFNTLLKYIYI